MSDLKDVAKTTTKVAISLLVPGGAVAVVAREIYKSCSNTEKDKGKCALRAIASGIAAQGLIGI